MKRKMIHIEEEKCNGCGLCAEACHEGAIEIVHGKARLLRDDYCDGLGDCLPTCPTEAISFEVREAVAYDEEAVKERMQQKIAETTLACGCPGTQVKAIRCTRQESVQKPVSQVDSELSQWPVQIKLVPVNAPYFDGAKLLIAADCTAYAYAAFHQKFIKDHITLVGCPKLDREDYAQKLVEILVKNEIKSISVVRMEVPCCGGMVQAVKEALIKSGKCLPWNVTVISTDGQVWEE